MKKYSPVKRSADALRCLFYGCFIGSVITMFYMLGAILIAFIATGNALSLVSLVLLFPAWSMLSKIAETLQDEIIEKKMVDGSANDIFNKLNAVIDSKNKPLSEEDDAEI